MIYKKYNFVGGHIKYLAAFTVLSVMSILLLTGFVGELEGTKSVGRGANDYGLATKGKICGDRLCSETGGKIIMPWEEKNKESEDTPTEEKITRDTNQEIDETKNSLDANVTGFGGILLPKANVPVTIPLHQGYYMGNGVYYIITDSSDPTHADIITKNQDWKVNLAPLLANATKNALSTTYMFTNGLPGDGVHGFQGEVFTSTPAQADAYSALTSQIHVTWDDEVIPRILVSEKEILSSVQQRLVVLTELNVVLNMPQIVWPEGQMPVKANKTLTNETPFVGGQILDIDLKNMTTTFIARQGWD